ncbi:MAG: hypothetical protein R3C46_01270 [Hyphomonadaceae bacterium]
MKLGSIVRPSEALPGRILIRSDGSRTHLLFATNVIDPNNKSERMVVMFREEAPAGYVHASALRESFWDITDIAEFRVDLLGHCFTQEHERHGDVYLTPDGHVTMAGDYRGQGGGFGYIHFDMKTGDERQVEHWKCARFQSWEIVVPQGPSEQPRTLYKWTPKKGAEASASYS